MRGRKGCQNRPQANGCRKASCRSQWPVSSCSTLAQFVSMWIVGNDKQLKWWDKSPQKGRLDGGPYRMARIGYRHRDTISPRLTLHHRVCTLHCKVYRVYLRRSASQDLSGDQMGHPLPPKMMKKFLSSPAEWLKDKDKIKANLFLITCPYAHSVCHL